LLRVNVGRRSSEIYMANSLHFAFDSWRELFIAFMVQPKAICCDHNVFRRPNNDDACGARLSASEKDLILRQSQHSPPFRPARRMISEGRRSEPSALYLQRNGYTIPAPFGGPVRIAALRSSSRHLSC
jgi:hypothetical protein